MKRQIRRNVFETNSSSTHSITICSEEEWEGFKDGKLAVNDAGKFMPVEKLLHNPDYDEEYTGRLIDPADSSWDNEYENYESYFDDEYLEGYYSYNYTTKSGDKIVAFGKYGHD